MTKYYKIIDGKTEYTISGKGVVKIGDCWVSNATDEMLLNDGWIEHMIPTRTLEQAKEEKIKEINEYDKSSAVNEFFIGESSVWFDKETRMCLNVRIDSEEMASKETTTLWYNNNSFVLPIREARNMLLLVELYAINCYDITAQHKANVSNLTTIEEVDNYDYTVNYPEKLNFNYE